ncbi:hypothetical protein HY772_07790 [Candidatus Woesearchaeota archaeon]|nr:hypothetical protein [Candidatus Woesearchaeota archaeon]
MKRSQTNGLAGTLTCPLCGHAQKLPIPNDRCVAAYVCEGCKKRISANESCCVFCDYGDKKCPVGAAAHRIQ